MSYFFDQKKAYILDNIKEKFEGHEAKRIDYTNVKYGFPAGIVYHRKKFDEHIEAVVSFDDPTLNIMSVSYVFFFDKMPKVTGKNSFFTDIEIEDDQNFLRFCEKMKDDFESIDKLYQWWRL